MIRSPFLPCIALGALMAVALGCNDAMSNPDRCNIRLVTLQPTGIMLHVGDTITVHASFTSAAATCLPGATLADLRWQDEGSLLTVDALTGHVTATAVGGDAVGVHLATSQHLLGDLGITVTP